MLNTKGLVTGIILGLLLQAVLAAKGVASSLDVPFPISVQKGDQYKPVAVADPATSRFLIVWSDRRSGGEAVYGQIMNADGTLFGKEIKISVAGRNVNPSLAYDSVKQRYLVIWTNVADDGRTAIHGRSVTADGTLASLQAIVAATASQVDNPRAAFDPKQQRFLIVWDCYCGAGDAGRNWDIHGRSFRSDLAPIGQSVAITNGRNNEHEQSASVAFDPITERFLIVWRHTATANHSQAGAIQGRLIAADMRFHGSILSISDSSVTSSAAVAADPINQIFLVGWVDNTSELQFQIVDSEGALLGFPVPIASKVSGQPLLLYNPATEQFLAVYAGNGDVFLDEGAGRVSILANGTPQRRSVSGLAHDPATRTTFIAWSQQSSALVDDLDIYGTMIRAPAQTASALSITSSLTPDTPANLARALSLFQSAEESRNARDWEMAEAKYKEFLSKYPQYYLAAPAHLNLGSHLSFFRDGTESMGQYAQASEKAPGTRIAHKAKLGMGALYYAWGEYAKTRDLFREVLNETKDWDLVKFATHHLKAMDLRLKQWPDSD